MPLDDVLAALPSLSPAERMQVRLALGGLNAIGAPAQATAPAHAGGRLAALVNDVLAEEGLPMHPLEQLVNATPRYATTSDMLFRWAEAAMPKGRRVDHMTVLAIGIRMLRKELAARNIPLAHTTVMRQLHRVPALVDKAFPGYARHGLLALMVGRAKVHDASTGS